MRTEASTLNPPVASQEHVFYGRLIKEAAALEDGARTRA
jgi:hypothetical protein